MVWPCGEDARRKNTQLSSALDPKHGKRSRGRPRKNWLSCVLEDAAIFTGVDNITIEDAEQQATNRAHWRGLIHRRKELLCGAGHSND